MVLGVRAAALTPKTTPTPKEPYFHCAITMWLYVIIATTLVNKCGGTPMTMENILVSTKNSPLKLNVGFIVHQTVGYYRDFPLEFPFIKLSPDLTLSNLLGNARVTRTAQGLLLQATVQADTTAECVRCLEEFRLALKIDFTELYAFSQKAVTDSGLIVPESGIIDFGSILREEMLLAVPINPLCQLDCKGLCAFCGENKNLVLCKHGEEDIDPRLDILKTLLEDIE